MILEANVRLKSFRLRLSLAYTNWIHVASSGSVIKRTTLDDSFIFTSFSWFDDRIILSNTSNVQLCIRIGRVLAILELVYESGIGWGKAPVTIRMTWPASLLTCFVYLSVRNEEIVDAQGKPNRRRLLFSHPNLINSRRKKGNSLNAEYPITVVVVLDWLFDDARLSNTVEEHRH